MHPSGRGRKQGNPWNVQPIKNDKIPNKSQSASAAETKFKEAQQKLQAAVEKYAKDYESSSSEDELESENVISSILKNYSQIGGQKENLGRTQAFLEDSLISGAATCLICIESIKRVEKIWSCKSCYCFFHLQCIERWSKDSVVQQKESQREQPQQFSAKTIQWGCPKCRYDYKVEDIPRDYFCFCGKTVNPAFHPWLVPHSCGEACGKKLLPLCGHQCILLCHPGPCPPCPKTVTVPCYCGRKPSKLQRCSNKEWSCAAPCKKTLSCGKHLCFAPCHARDCAPCSKRSMQKCCCGAQEQLRDCATPTWQCDKVCGRPLSCGNHFCAHICHGGSCEECVLTKPRLCPCGKTAYELPCTEETPTCGDTCGKLLECGSHTCNQRCHKDKCGTCLELAVKSCRCGLHEKEVQCKKQYLCESKCKRIRDCNKHPCNRKCCDGNCPPCEKPCGRTLPCGLHKCPSVCHRGPCYPCQLTTAVHCRCGVTSITVPCGREKRTRPPRCLRSCRVAPDCHHDSREPHRCHFGDCPPCRQICNKKLTCAHLCPRQCHSAVMVKVEGPKASMPWERIDPYMEKKALPCPPCEVPCPVTCLGGHDTSLWPCHSARPAPCGRPCGRELPCGNHDCQLQCHVVEDGSGNNKAGSNCEQCENGCSASRPEGCQHDCPKPCHPGACPPCKIIQRLKCHCGLNQAYGRCSEWTSPDVDKEQLQSCGIQCPRNYECGHRCKSNCHSGPCPNPEQCKKKVKVFCPCKRMKKEFSCEFVRNNAAVVECDDVCQQKKEEEQKLREMEQEARRKEEELRNARELERFQKKMQGKKKYRDRKRTMSEVEDRTFLQKYWMFIVAFFIAVFALYISLFL